MYLVVFFQV